MKLRNLQALLWCSTSLVSFAMDDAQPSAPLKLIGVPEIFNLTDQQIKQTRFYQAICEGHIDLVKGMVDRRRRFMPNRMHRNRRINPNAVLTWHSLFVSGPGSIGFLPITHTIVYADPNKFKDETRHSEQFIPLTLAVAQNQFDIVRFLVEECKVNINGCVKNILHPLHVAIDNGNIDLVQYLIDHGANPLYKDKSSNHHTALEAIDSGLAFPKELGPDRITKLQKIKPIIEKALRTRNYPDPYADPDSSSASDSDDDADGDTNSAVAESPDATDGDGDEDDTDEDADNDGNPATKSPPLLPSSSSNTFNAIPSHSSSADPSNNGKGTSFTCKPVTVTEEDRRNACAWNPNSGNIPTHEPNARIGDDAHTDGHPVLKTKYSWEVIATAAVGIACGVIGIKKLYTWYTSENEEEEQDADQNVRQNDGEVL